jgi:glutaredoxin-like protein NrdH
VVQENQAASEQSGHYVFVDLLSGSEKDAAVKKLEKWNPRCSFPTIVINEEKCIVGFKEDEIKEALS